MINVSCDRIRRYIVVCFVVYKETSTKPKDNKNKSRSSVVKSRTDVVDHESIDFSFQPFNLVR